LADKINFLYRILDANINRTLEGLRVCEDTMRFVWNNYYLSRKLKNLRHRLNKIIKKMELNKKILLKARDTEKDIGKKSSFDELQRKDFKDILFANLQRVKESLRVLEEFSKIIDKRIAQEYKEIRYEVYKIEKKIALSI
jgi:thiamine-phosphate pyrophosphorylase